MDVRKLGNDFQKNYHQKNELTNSNQNNNNYRSSYLLGNIKENERINFQKKLSNNIVYKTKYLPEQSYCYGGQVFQVIPTFVCWHWDGGVTPKTANPNKGLFRTLATWRTLVQRTNQNDPVSTHFSVGPNSVLQMLPMSNDYIIQGRLSNDHNIQDIQKAKSLGGIQIETTGDSFDKRAPDLSQTKTLLELTFNLMKKYSIPFKNICGHLERSPRYIYKIDPGIKYLRETRVLLLKVLIKNKEWQLIGNPKEWFFYKEVFKDNYIQKECTQTPQDILNALTSTEKNAIYFNIGNVQKLENGMQR